MDIPFFNGYLCIKLNDIITILKLQINKVNYDIKNINISK